MDLFLEPQNKAFLDKLDEGLDILTEIIEQSAQVTEEEPTDATEGETQDILKTLAVVKHKVQREQEKLSQAQEDESDKLTLESLQKDLKCKFPFIGVLA